MKNYLSFSALALALIFFSCKKTAATPVTNNPVANNPTQSQNSIAAGNSGPSLILSSVSITLAPIAFGGQISHDIDVNGDGQGDFRFIEWSDFTMAHSYLSSSRMRISTLNSNSFISTDSLYAKISYTNTVVQQQNGQYLNDSTSVQVSIDSLSAKVIALNGTISTGDHWHQGNFNLMTYYSDPSHTQTHYDSYEGHWLELDNQFIGVRFQNSLGWIKISTKDHTLKVYSFAMTP